MSCCLVADGDINSLFLNLYLDKRSVVPENTGIRLRERQRAQPVGTLKTECSYVPVLLDFLKNVVSKIGG